jgi:hypothetical protein
VGHGWAIADGRWNRSTAGGESTQNDLPDEIRDAPAIANGRKRV